MLQTVNDYTVRPHIDELRDIEQQEFRPAVLRCLSRGDPVPQMTFRKVGRDMPYQVGLNVSPSHVATISFTE